MSPIHRQLLLLALCLVCVPASQAASLGDKGMDAPAPPPATATAARAMLDKLVAFPTTSGSDAVQQMAQYLEGQFIDAGFDQADIELIPVDDGIGMIVRYRPAATTATTKKPVLFLAHMDVVEANREGWATDPWVLTEQDGFLYGRGVVDDKFGVLTLAQAFMRLKREGFVPDRELVLAFSGDEETGMATTRVLAERLKGAAFAVNSDAGGGYRGKDGTTTYGIQAAEKTYATFELTTRNKGGHSSVPRPDNAINELAVALLKISAHRFPVKWNDVSLAGFTALAPAMGGDIGKAMARFATHPGDPSAVAVLEQDPGTDRDLRTTCVATLLRAGTVENALPPSATATVNCRIFPGESIDGVRSILAQLAGNPAMEIKILGEPAESPVSEIPDEARRALDAVLAIRAPGASVSPYMEAGGTDGLWFRRAGIPTVGMGPLFSTDDSNYSFHGNNERLPLEEFNGGLDHFYLFIKALAGGEAP